MDLFECDFFPDDSEMDAERYLDAVVYPFLAALHRNGSIIGSPSHLVQLEDRLRLFCITPAEDALDARSHTPVIQGCLDRVLQRSRQPPFFRRLGTAAGLPDCCSCEDSGWYVLFTTFLSEGPPVECGDCGQPVPLYRLPPVGDDDEQSDIRGWAGNYQAYDTLFMLSGPGERSGYRQMARLDSALTREGRRICKTMAEQMGKPWYYYLHRYGTPQPEACPGCGNPWKLNEPLHGLYAYKCDRCCLVSMETVS
jgi:predicted  nucleic acid-binding Zn ribbon protein